MSPAVEATGLARRFGRRWAFAHVDLRVEVGERLLVIGANGSGKTTLLRVLSTLLGASAGALRLFGQEVGTDLELLRARVGLVSHQPGVYEDLSGEENLAIQAGLLRRSPPPNLLASVGLDGRTDPVRTWSAGMRKRLSLALLLHKQPELVLLDEPFAALDPRGMDAMGALIRGMPGTVIVASHQIERSGALCDRALLLDQGLPRWTGPASQAWSAWTALHGHRVAEADQGPEGATAEAG